MITISGRHLALVELFEERATQPSYAGMIYNLFDVIDPAQGDSILDVGCGSGAIDRLLVRRFGDANPLTAVELNPFLLREAVALDTPTLREPERVTFESARSGFC